MEQETLRRAVELAQAMGRLIIATSGPDGMPHVAVARKVTYRGNGTVEVDEWFCPGTVTNAHEGAPVSLVAWDEGRDAGWQLLGNVVGVEDRAMLNGFHPEERSSHVPQVLRSLRVRVSKALSFSQAPHDDREA
jgi:hypothetical protein